MPRRLARGAAGTVVHRVLAPALSVPHAGVTIPVAVPVFDRRANRPAATEGPVQSGPGNREAVTAVARRLAALRTGGIKHDGLS